MPRLAVFMGVCEGEFEIARHTLDGLLQACRGAEIQLFLVDDASPSRVGARLADEYRGRGIAVDCSELPRGLGFRGTTQRLFKGLARIVESGFDFDLVIRLDADSCVLRPDLLPFMMGRCPDRRGLYGVLLPMRLRDSVLLWADHLPLGFKRKSDGAFIEHRWELSRGRPVWWSDFGYRSWRHGYRPAFMAGAFMFLGFETVRRMYEQGYLTRDQSRHGFMFQDDVLITIAAYATGHPVVDLRKDCVHWDFLGTTERTPIEPILQGKPYVVHHLKNNPDAWARRRELHAAAAQFVS